MPIKPLIYLYWYLQLLQHMKKSLLSVCLLSFFCNLFAQRNYYFSNTTSAEGLGTKDRPYQSLQKLSRILFKPGDTVFFNGGDIFSGNILLSKMNGTKNRPIVFTSSQNGIASIHAGNNEALLINNASNFKIINLNFLGAGRKTGNTTNGIKIVNCTDCFLQTLDISGFQKAGLLLYNCVNTKAEGILAHDNGACGILVEGDYKKRISNNIQIVNCRADNNPGDPTNFNNHSGNGILAGNCKNVLIEYCTATNNGWDMPRIGNGPVGIWAYEADSVTIQYCIAYKNKTAKGASDGGGFDLDGGVTNSVIQYCLSYQNWGSGYGIYQYYSASNWFNNTVRYCISINDGTVTHRASSMLIWNGNNADTSFHHFYAYNNFFYNDAHYTFGFDPLSSHNNFYFLNNIFIAADTSDISMNLNSSKSDTYLGNVWMKKSGGFSQDGFTDIAKWAAASGHEQLSGKLTGTVLQKKIFDIPAQIEITLPYLLSSNPLLQSLCNDTLNNKGINIKKILGIDAGEKDFFGIPMSTGNEFEPGICIQR